MFFSIHHSSTYICKNLLSSKSDLHIFVNMHHKSFYFFFPPKYYFFHKPKKSVGVYFNSKLFRLSNHAHFIIRFPMYLCTAVYCNVYNSNIDNTTWCKCMHYFSLWKKTEKMAVSTLYVWTDRYLMPYFTLWIYEDLWIWWLFCFFLCLKNWFACDLLSVCVTIKGQFSLMKWGVTHSVVGLLPAVFGVNDMDVKMICELGQQKKKKAIVWTIAK